MSKFVLIFVAVVIVAAAAQVSHLPVQTIDEYASTAGERIGRAAAADPEPGRGGGHGGHGGHGYHHGGGHGHGYYGGGGYHKGGGHHHGGHHHGGGHHKYGYGK